MVRPAFWRMVAYLALLCATAVYCGEVGSRQVDLASTVVWTWGSNRHDWLGRSTEKNWTHTPGPVEGLTEVRSIAVGYFHCLALDSAGTVWAWGKNDSGQLGDGTDEHHRCRPVQVIGLNGVTQIAAGRLHSLALKSDGTVWAWGYNASSQIGDGSTVEKRNIPTRVQRLSDIVSVSTRMDHSLALGRDGTVWAWGENDHMQLGTGDHRECDVPVPVSGLMRADSICAGGYDSIAISNGTLLVWGTGARKVRTKPTVVRLPSRVVKVAGGDFYTLAVLADGTVWAWGDPRCDMKGVTEEPQQVLGLAKINNVAAGMDHALAVGEDGTLWAWGKNRAGQLGDGTRIDRTEPTQVKITGNVSAIGLGWAFSAALSGAPEYF